MALALRHRSRAVVVLAVVVATALLATLVLHARHTPSSGTTPGIDLSRSDDNPATRMAATQFRVSTFNVLGAGHTEPDGDKPSYASGYTRMGWAVQLIKEHSLEVVGFQELQRVQFDRFMELVGRKFGIFTGDEFAEAAMHNSIVWRLDKWKLIQKRVVKITYFEGVEIRMPLVLLENLETNQRAWFSNFHNPANPPRYGDQEKWRDEATRREIAMVNALRVEFPTTPVLMLGDFNEREEFFCRVARRAGMNAANGGGITPDDRCIPPAVMPVDWIMGTPDVGFTYYRALRTPLVKKTTDHPLVISDASIAPQSVQASPIRRVVAISVEGLRSGILDNLSAAEIPALTRLRTQGAGTLEARSMWERTTSLPNDTSMLTGLRISASAGGHGLTASTDTGGVVHTRAGRYVSSVFDLVHNFGRGTAVYTSDRGLGLLDRSWNATYGGADLSGLSNGTDKIDTFVVEPTAGAAASRAAEAMQSSPRAFTFLQLNGPAVAGRLEGYRSTAYAAAVRRTDRQLARILNALDRNPVTAGRTLVILTSEHGGTGRSDTDPTVLGNVRVPFFVMGPGVEPGGDLYALNPHYTNPRNGIPDYTAGRPVRPAFVTNLALMALRLPSAPGSAFNFEQDLNVFSGQ